ncbi:EAL domain-containing protein [Kineococcus rhizosphaerae]|uniref:EAL domain-containing protein (Putative c-di-GMP-specific phosphodiesterase class I) n=1 Tax=Kineococcus rhizosphaerae TaxID=559628 RepID=A0A2T0R4P6_9ACTN|nr:EAL domain-containing protein [Kineococcus rhizosphaerae]PRY15348.1 EAL domain-containing protein (putative c-di-GMP-specific phosphodiesterase class I) [Kineococcus rhizosphaerae]
MTTPGSTLPSTVRAATAPGPGAADAGGPAPVWDVDRVLDEGAVRTVFQCVHDARTGRPVAVEAFVRGPQDSALASPAQLLRAAAGRGRLADLDRSAHEHALAAVAALPAPWTVFLNSSVEGVAPDLPEVAAHVIVDVDARTLLAQPGRALRLARRSRARGWGVALDGAGADLDVLALLPVLEPDVVKLDLRALARRTRDEVAGFAALVGAYAAATGALVLAEAVESADDLERAQSFGADLLQGWDVAPTGPLPSGAPEALPRPDAPRPPVPGASPDALARLSALARPANADVVERSLEHLRLRARREPDPSVVVSLGGAAARRAAADLGHVAVRAHADLDGHGLAVLAPHVATVVVTRPAGGPAGGRELAVSHDRALVTALVAEALSSDRAPAPADPVVAVRPPSPAPPLAEVVSQALEADRRTGTGTGLLLVGVDGTSRRGGREDVVRRMRRAVRSVDRWIPLGADQFAVLLTGLPRAGSEGVVERVADALLMAVELAVDDHPSLSVSIGASLAPDRAATGVEAHRQAVAALESARGAGGHCARIWPV